MAAAILRSFLRSLSLLSSSTAAFRPGTSVPASHAPLQSAPPARKNVRGGNVDRATLRQSLGSATAEGMVAELVAATSSGAVLTGWALYLGCTPFLIGVLGALPFLGQAIQFPAVWLTSRFGKRRVAILAVAASRQALLPMIALPFLPLEDGGKQAVLLATAAISAVLAVIGNNAWVEWMGDLVPSSVHGRYFGRRTALCAVAGTFAALFAGLVLDRSGLDRGTAFSVLAAVACLAGAVSTVLMRRQHDPSPEVASAPRPDLSAALAPLRDPGARRFLTYLVCWNIALGMASSFYAVHMLENLGLGFAVVALYNAAVAASRMFGATVWGRVIDRVGARPVLLACSFLLVLLPAGWILTVPGRAWWLAVDALLAGFLWAGHSLAAFALPLAVSPRQGRRFYLATFSASAGLAFALACTAAGALAEAIPTRFTMFGQTFFDLHVLFAISSVLRIAASLVGLRILQPGTRPIDAVVPVLKGELATAIVGRRQTRG